MSRNPTVTPNPATITRTKRFGLNVTVTDYLHTDKPLQPLRRAWQAVRCALWGEALQKQSRTEHSGQVNGDRISLAPTFHVVAAIPKL